MQMYSGLPIMTNKISQVEQRGVPHHLLGHASLSEEPFIIDDFTREATRIMAEIRERGNLPIVVGGTAYYVDALLFSDVTLSEYPQQEPLPLLDEPTEVLLAELKKVDPEMAKQWHPNDRRKIRRSLEIYLRTGQRASDLYAEQKERRHDQSSLSDSPWENLLFWVYSEREVLKERLDSRIDKMVEQGLMDEVRQLSDFKRKEEAAGRTVDMTKGIWQVIGYKQFEPYLQALNENKTGTELEQIRSACEEDMKTSTRRYALSQNKWTRNKKIPRLRQESPQALDSLYILDSTNVSLFQDAVVESAAQLTRQFLEGQPRAHPRDISELARTVLEDAIRSPPSRTLCEKTCDICGVTAVTEEQWEIHLRSRNHRVRMKKKKRLSLIPVEKATKDVVKSDVIEPEIGDLFSP